ncbi:hypothetical protein [Pelagicoccus albus]|uniref:Uncharacterized protein n=1 Tax=Pelagicoccus albus TaxID=415222 RepID=A0A7X1E7Z6_9BACT|nr:hypothetical protein [Pelagicoccus albus]MBC2606275.1 hypothetical protein [Pelagicoccus albus]
MILLNSGTTYFFNRHRIWIVLLAVSILAIGIGLQPAYRGFKAWRAERVLTESQTLLEEEAYLRSFQKAQTAVMLDGSNKEASRHLAELALNFRHPQAHEFWRKLVNTAEATERDWEQAVDAALLSQNASVAFKYLEEWKIRDQAEPAALALREARAFLLVQDYRTALSIVSQALQSGTVNRDLQFLYLNLSGALAETSELEAAMSRALESPKLDQTTLLWISMQKELSDETRIQALRRLLQVPGLGLREQLQLGLRAARLGDKTFSAQLESLKPQIDLENAEQLDLYAQSLWETGKAQAVVDLLEASAVPLSGSTQATLMLALIELGRADEALDFCSDQNPESKTSLAQESLIRAIVFQKQGARSKRDENLQRALSEAGLDDLDFFEREMQRLGQAEQMLALYRRLATETKTRGPLFQNWFDMALDQKDESELLSCILAYPQDLVKTLPPAKQGQLNYYGLLLAGDKAPFIEATKSWSAKFPLEPLSRELLAFANWQENRPQLAKETLSLQAAKSPGKEAKLIRALILGEELPETELPYLEAELKLRDPQN